LHACQRIFGLEKNFTGSVTAGIALRWNTGFWLIGALQRPYNPLILQAKKGAALKYIF
jgi:hypothetical protein